MGCLVDVVTRPNRNPQTTPLNTPLRHSNPTFMTRPLRPWHPMWRRRLAGNIADPDAGLHHHPRVRAPHGAAPRADQPAGRRGLAELGVLWVWLLHWVVRALCCLGFWSGGGMKGWKGARVNCVCPAVASAARKTPAHQSLHAQVQGVRRSAHPAQRHHGRQTHAAGGVWQHLVVSRCARAGDKGRDSRRREALVSVWTRIGFTTRIIASKPLTQINRSQEGDALRSEAALQGARDGEAGRHLWIIVPAFTHPCRRRCFVIVFLTDLTLRSRNRSHPYPLSLNTTSWCLIGSRSSSAQEAPWLPLCSGTVSGALWWCRASSPRLDSFHPLAAAASVTTRLTTCVHPNKPIPSPRIAQPNNQPHRCTQQHRGCRRLQRLRRPPRTHPPRLAPAPAPTRLARPSHETGGVSHPRNRGRHRHHRVTGHPVTARWRCFFARCTARWSGWPGGGAERAAAGCAGGCRRWRHCGCIGPPFRGGGEGGGEWDQRDSCPAQRGCRFSSRVCGVAGCRRRGTFICTSTGCWSAAGDAADNDHTPSPSSCSSPPDNLARCRVTPDTCWPPRCDRLAGCGSVCQWPGW